MCDQRYTDQIFTDPAEILSAVIDPKFRSATSVLGYTMSPPPSASDEVNCGSIKRDRLGVVVVAGQSNGANTTATDDMYKPRRFFLNLNIEDGKCYVARSQAIGTTGLGSSVILPLADELLDAGVFENVIVVPISVGGTFIEEWRPAGRYFHRYQAAFAQLAKFGLSPTIIVWHQGEGNAIPLMTEHTIGIFGATENHRPVLITPELKAEVGASYISLFRSMVERLRQEGVTAPVFASTATTCGSEKVDPTIRSAQMQLPDDNIGIFPGSDTDLLDFSNRYDRCHFSSRGIVLHAKYLTSIIAAHLGIKVLSPPPPVCRLEIESEQRPEGENATLLWAAMGAKRVAVDHGIGTLPGTRGKTQVSPVHGEGTYRMSAFSEDGQEVVCSTTYYRRASSIARKLGRAWRRCLIVSGVIIAFLISIVVIARRRFIERHRRLGLTAREEVRSG